MKFSVGQCANLVGRVFSYRIVFRLAALAAVFFLLQITTPPMAQAQVADGTPSDRQTIELLLQRIDRLEARVAQLESAKQPPPAAAPSQPSAAAAAPETVAQEAAPEHPEGERMDVSKTLMKIRGFGDVTFHGDNRHGDNTSFTLGQLNLFITSDISERFKFLGELVFEADSHNSFGAEFERYLLQYSRNDYFNVSIGRYHSAIGYYNTAYHHSTWLQTATGRPLLFEFEDRGGPLPVHTVGVSVTGLVPSGRVGWHYVAEVGNGRASLSPGSEPVQNVVDENNGKSFNLAFLVKPEAVRGLQAGFSAYHDGLKPAGLANVTETILAAHAVLVRPNFEWLNEALLIRHAVDGSRTFNTPGFYTQVSKRFASYRPYFRYQYINEPDAEPVFPQLGRREGPSVGLRFDPSESVAIKLQYDYTMQRHLPATNGLALQFGFTF